MTIVNVGIDLAKNVFALHGVNEIGQLDLRRPIVPRAKLHELVAALPPCIIGMEACSGAHHWARLFARCGHTVKLMAPKLVTPYRMSGKRGKTDAADAAAICEAVQRPNMRFVPVQTVERQSRLMVHRTRQGFVESRTAIINRIRGLLAEFGIVLPQKAQVVRREAARHMDGACPDLASSSSRTCSMKSATSMSGPRPTTRTCAAWLGTARPRSS
jgi:transposase